MHQSVFLKTQLAGEANPKAKPNTKLNGKEYICLYESGQGSRWYDNQDWKLHDDEVEELEAVHLSDDYSTKTERRKNLQHREPSKQGAIERSAATLFEAKSTDIMDFGSAIHEMFEKVEWVEDADVDGIVAEWKAGSVYQDDVSIDAAEQFRNCMASDAIRGCLSRPEGDAEVWLEKRFEVVLEEAFVSGAFDRVIVVRDDDGNAVSAAIYDYKSSMGRIDDKVEGYTPQMETYRDALSIILSLDKNKITLNLIFTKQQQLRTL